MDNKLSELKAAAMAATPGPWFRSSVQFNGITTESTFITQGNKPHVASTSEKRDAIFIAAANPAAVLALLAENEHVASDLVARNGEIEGLKKRADELLAELEVKSMECRGIQQERELFRVERATHQKYAQELEQRVAELSELETKAKVWESAATKHLARAEEAEKRLPILEQDKLRLNEIINSEANRADEAEKRLATPVRLPALLHPESDAVNGMIFANGRNEAIAECSVAIRQAGFLSEASPMTVAGDE